MKQRHSNGQLLPLRERRTETQMAKRSERAEYRSNIAKQIGIINFGLAQFFRRGVFGRFKWLLTGR
jgi:hypothetical protein